MSQHSQPMQVSTTFSEKSGTTSSRPPDFTRAYGSNVILESLTADEAYKYLTDDYQIWLVK